MSATTSLSTLLGIRHPIIQAPMAGVSTPRLAAAVSEAGGLGSIAVGAGSAAQARAAIQEVRKLTAKPFNVNVFTHRPAQADPAREAQWLDYLRPHFSALGAEPPGALREIYTSFLADPAMLEVLASERPAVVSFHFGLPSADQIAALRAAGCMLLASATSLEEALAAEAAGMDAVVAQGYEAGGHRGVFDHEQPDPAIGTLALVRLLAARLRIPVVAAGGIMDGQGIAAVQRLGAASAQLGTAFILCPESSATAHHRQLMRAGAGIGAGGGGAGLRTAITAAISGRPARGLVNRFFDGVGAPGHPPLPDYPIAYDAAKALVAAAGAQGVQDYTVNWAGQGFQLARELPAAELVERLAAEMAHG
ncbi:nitronate monooxygenase family protein [Massilia sp. ST3]|uniref:NAD(P)H-dependent flavin oxidoreductase n=1 Tax=Massilia sp. ST3 TaxID=2824903 RepID=UPI001B83B368|nr:nitronate monooxygenase [Massilia sp. ST3]MBQ5946094.1 nitronate monooxygenase [Massilia sp. ST3]